MARVALARVGWMGDVDEAGGEGSNAPSCPSTARNVGRGLGGLTVAPILKTLFHRERLPGVLGEGTGEADGEDAATWYGSIIGEGLDAYEVEATDMALIARWDVGRYVVVCDRSGRCVRR